MSGVSIAPDRTLDELDKGDDTQRRFRYQAAIAAIVSLDMLRADSKIEEIFCEHHEDILVKIKGEGFIGYQVKTRELGRGPFTFNSPEIMRTLERFVKSERTFPQHFKRYVIAANCGFSKKYKDYRNMTYCFKILRSKTKDKSIFSDAFNARIDELSLRVSCTREFVINVLKKVWVQETPSLEEYEVYLADQIAMLTPNVSQDHLVLKQAATSLIETMLQAASLTHTSPRTAYFALLEKPDSARTDAIINGKRITKATVQIILGRSTDLSETKRLRTTRKIDLSTQDAKIIGKSLREYAKRVVSDYNNFSFFKRSGTKPLIEEMSKFDLKKYYIPLELRDLKSRRIYFAYDLIEEWIRKGSTNGLFVLGDFGTGKSTLCSYISYRLAAGFLNNTNDRIPIFIPLRYVKEISKKSILRFLGEMLKINQETLSWLSRSGKLVLIFDGFDEIAKRTHWEKTLSDFKAIVELFCRGESLVLVTCRPHYFFKDSQIWGEETGLMESLRATKNFRIASIEPFRRGQILELLKRRTKNPDKVWNQINKTYNLRDLSERPLLLDMIISTLPKLVSLGVSVNAATLYDTYTGDWIDREEWRSQLTPDQKAELMEKIAYDMFIKKGSNIPFYSFKQIVENKFKVKLDSEVADYYDYDIRTCSFFNRDSEGNYSFIHRSFLEFFLAKKIAREVNHGSFPNFLAVKSLPAGVVRFAGLMVVPDQKEMLLDEIEKTKTKPASARFIFLIVGANTHFV